MKELKEKVDEFDPELINTDESGVNDEMQEPISMSNVDDAGENEKITEQTHGPEPMLYAEVFLPHGD